MRRRFIRTVSYLLTVCVIFAATGYFLSRAKGYYESRLERVRLESLNSLCGYMHEISSGLNLLAVSSGESVADSVYYVGTRITGAMGNIVCFSRDNSENINRFLTEVYDFSQSFSGDDEARKKASQFSDYAEEIYYHLSDLSVAVLNGEYRTSEYESIYKRSNKPHFEDFLDYSNGKEDELFSQAEAVSLQAEKFSFVASKKTALPEEMKAKGSRITGVKEILWRESGYDSLFYEIYHGETFLEFCKKGGYICRFITPPVYGERLVDTETAKGIAAGFIADCGYGKTELLTAETDDFTSVFCFVPEVNGVHLISANIMVEVSLCKGNVTYFDARGFLENYHTEVEYGEIFDVCGLLPHNVRVERTLLCTAEIDGEEKLCILAECSFCDGEVWIYVDYNTRRIIKTAPKGGF